MKTIGASVAIRNAIEYDFCIEECIRSIEPVCDEIIVADHDSTDGTWDMLERIRDEIPKVILLRYVSDLPHNDGLYVMTWTNWIRERLSTDYNFQMDADEVLHESAVVGIKHRVQHGEVSLLMRRWNFWLDTKHVIPFGKCCSSEVIRVAPKWCWLPADVPLPQGQDAMDRQVNALGFEIFHYGFLRKRQSFFKKERFLQNAFTGGFDPKLDALEKEPEKNWMQATIDQFGEPLMDFNGTHPAVAHQWLKDRGYEP